jgi:signal transduction histidine kinase
MSPDHWQNTPFTIPLVLIGLLCAWVAYASWRRRSVPEAVPFAVLMAAIAGWTLLNLVEKSLTVREPRLIVSRLVYVFILTTPAAWLTFAVSFARWQRWPPRRMLPWLLLEPLLVLVLVWTTPYHNLFRTPSELKKAGDFWVIDFTYGPLFWVHTFYTYLLFLIGAVFVVAGMAQRRDWNLGRLVVTLAGMLVPVLGNAAYILGLQPKALTDLTPVYFAVTGLAAAWMIFRVRLIDILPIARDFVLDCLHDPIIVLDNRCRILDVNPAGRTLLPDPSLRVRQQPLRDIFPELSQYLSSQLPSGGSTTEIKLCLAGVERFWSLHVLPMVDHEVQLGVLVRLTDVTERKYAEEERAKLLAREQAARTEAERLLKAAGEAERRKDAFLATLGHELRNPLASIHNAVQLLQRAGSTGATVAQAGEVLQRQVKHLTRLVDDLLDVVRIARGKIQLHTERLDLVPLVRGVAADQRENLEAAGLTLTLDLPAHPVWVRGDPTRLAQVLDNLLVNGAKFTDRGGRVTVRLTTDPEGRRALVAVRDTGIGVAMELLPHLFETFTQADRSLTRSQGGLGLGLSLVKGLVQLHGGEVSAVSEGLGKGAEFTFWIPWEQDALPPVAQATEAAGPSARRWRVLVIEDNHDTADTLRLLLESYEHEVAVAYTGPDGVSVARGFQPEVVLADVGLPGMDGYAVARALRQDPTTAKVRLIAVTGYGQAEDQRRAREAGFDYHLTKPVDFEEILRVLAAL